MNKWFGFSKKAIPLIVLLAALSVVVGVFFLRPPVLLVSDFSFRQIYGSQRFSMAVIHNSLSLFRRVIPVSVSEFAGPDVISLIVSQAFSSPHAVIFPKRYVDAARMYAAEHPDVPVVVVWGRNFLPQSVLHGSNIIFVRTDSAADMLIAGQAAAALVPKEEKSVLLFTDGTLQVSYQQAFEEGLRFNGMENPPIFLEAFLDHGSYAEIGSVVVSGPAFRFIERNLDIPIVLFSWIDPVMTPHSVRMIFNDSPLALTVDAVRAISHGSREIFLPSQVIALSERMETRQDGRALAQLAALRSASQENIENF